MIGRNVILTVFILTLGPTIQAQQSINATGGDASGSGGRVSYSIGQVDYNTGTGISGTVSEGVQQPLEIYITSITKLTVFNFSLSVFPNPTHDNLILQAVNFNEEELHYQLLDVNGKLLCSERIAESKTQINLVNLPPAIYFIRITMKDNTVKLFKLIKY